MEKGCSVSGNGFTWLHLRSVLILASLLVSSCGHQQMRQEVANNVNVSSVDTTASPLAPTMSWRDHEITRLMIQGRLKKMGYFRDDVERHMVDRGAYTMIERIDPEFLYFTQHEADVMVRDAKPTDPTIGYRLSDLDAILTKFRERQGILRAYVGQRLDATINLNQSGRYAVPRERFATLEEIKLQWDRRIVVDAVELAAHGTPEAEIPYRLRKHYDGVLSAIQRADSSDRVEIIQTALLQSVDPHGSFYSHKTTAEIDALRQSQLVGIGAVVEARGPRTIIAEIVPGGPLAQVGNVLPDDEILAVGEPGSDFENVYGLSLEETVALLRGERGSQVKLRLRRQEELLEVAIARQEVYFETKDLSHEVLSVMTEGGPAKIAYIKLPTFYADFQCMDAGKPNCRSATADLRYLLQSLLGMNVKGIVIDLRDNGGGALKEGNGVMSLFIGDQPTMQIKSKDGIDTLTGGSPTVMDDTPLVMLVNRKSAGASEIFAAAVQDYGRGVVVGYRTYGLGMLQSMQPLDNGQRVKLTMAEYFRVKGEQVEGEGVTPDIRFSFSPQKMTTPVSVMPAKLAPLSIQPMSKIADLSSLKQRFYKRHPASDAPGDKFPKSKPLSLSVARAELKSEIEAKGSRSQGDDRDRAAAIEVLTLMIGGH